MALAGLALGAVVADRVDAGDAPATLPRVAVGAERDQVAWNADRWVATSPTAPPDDPTDEPAVTSTDPTVEAFAPPEPGPPPPEPDPGPVINPPPPTPDRVAPAREQGSRPSTPSGASTAVYPGDFPDPFVLHAHGVYWAFGTQVGWTKVPVLRSLDMSRWEWVGDALHELPAWAQWGHNWAPAVLERDSTFVLYYTARHREYGLQCISRAVSALPQGPYVDRSDAPLVCQTERGGSIDPSPFVDADGRTWLLWKSEGTLLGEPTRIWVQRLTGDGQRLTGRPAELLERRLPWEHPIIENPAMAFVDGHYHLFYSGNRWETDAYAVGHAICESVTGPCRRSSDRPVLTTRPGEAGPGGQEVARGPGGELVLVHHAWEPGAVGYDNGGLRRLHVSSLRFDGARVEVGGPWEARGPSDLVDEVAPLRATRAAGSDPGGLTTRRAR